MKDENEIDTDKETSPELLALFGFYLRKMGFVGLSDTTLAYRISEFLDVDFGTANKAVTDSLERVAQAIQENKL